AKGRARSVRAKGGAKRRAARRKPLLVSAARAWQPRRPLCSPARPFEVELAAGRTYAWCACGHSKKQPFCDGAHRRAARGAAPLRFEAAATGRVKLCGCKRTRSPPFCDGSHAR
ncbi:CISD3 protein, partial [Crypturellus soui]|nr:CISD3 protein [Crypturellus soui]